MDNDTLQMTCEQVEDELSGYLDDVLDPQLRRSVEAHLATCGACPVMLADFQRGDEMLRALPFIEPPSDMRDRFFNSPRYLKLAEARAHPRNFITPLTAALVAAAMLVVALSGALLIRQGVFAPQQATKSGTMTTIGNPGDGAPLPAGPRLIYERGGALWSAAESGAGLPRQLTPVGIQVAGWSVSPNGRAVIYIDAHTGALHAIRADALNDTVIGTVTGGKNPQAGFWSTSTGVAIAGGLAWSPDNTRVAYVAQSNDGAALHVMNATGAADTVAQSVTGGLIGHLLWSADSVYIAYTISPAPVSDVQGLAVYNVTTAVVTPIAAPADTNAPTAIVGQLAWLPNHTPAALTWAARAGGEVTGVFRASVASGASVTRLTPVGTTYTAADVSVSGAWLLARGSTLATIAADQTSPQVAMTLGHTATLVDWAPSGQVAAVLSGDALSLLTPDGGLVTIAHGLTAQSLVVWSPESAALAWQSGNTVVSAQIHQGAASGAKSVAQNADVLALVWAPDGQSLAVRSSAGLLLVTADGAHIRATDGQATSGGQLSWSLAG
jgi:hypothetical protein